MALLSRVWAVAAVRAQRESVPVAAGARNGLAGLFPQAAALAAARAAVDDGRRVAGADESLRRAMYVSCWGAS